MWSFLRYLSGSRFAFAIAAVLTSTTLAHDTEARDTDLSLNHPRLTDAVDLASSAEQRPFSGNKGAALTHGPETLWKAFDHQESDTPSVEAVAAPMHGRLVLLRHADRDPSETDLNAIGRARAAALPDALADLPLDAIFMTGFQRNADTAAPLAQVRALAPRVLEDNAELPRALAEAASGRNAIWIGNVGNLSHLWDAYRLPGRGPIEYGDIAVLTAENGVWQVEWRRVDP